MVTVDQLRGDLLDRYQPAFEGGFARLYRDGYRYSGASHLHSGTYTAAGHATLATGVFPSRSGIVSNSWDQRLGDGWLEGMYAVEDPDSPILGMETLDRRQGRSPRNLLTTGIADWILAADANARAVSISGKDRAAVTMAGRAKAEVYWLRQREGRFVTSTYYKEAYPQWVQRYNTTEMPRILSDRVWDSTVPDRFRGLARPDEGVPYEGDRAHTTFPHTAADEVSNGDADAFNAWALNQPRMDRAVLGLATVAIDALDLGQRSSVDFLSVSLSATDYVGHGYGPLSQEQLDNLVRLDRELGAFFDHLDWSVGVGNWLLGFSADHGVVTIPEVQYGEGLGGRRISAGERAAAVERAYADALALVGGDEDRAATVFAEFLEARGLVAEAYTRSELRSGAPADTFAVLFRNSYYPGRAAGPESRRGVEIRTGVQDLVSDRPGTTHGSPYWYDRWVPFVVMGPGVRPGLSDRAVYTVDMAPTLAALAGITSPPDRDGRALLPGR